MKINKSSKNYVFQSLEYEFLTACMVVNFTVAAEAGGNQIMLNSLNTKLDCGYDWVLPGKAQVIERQRLLSATPHTNQ
jgi:hypothetical protein